jgi:hypothetical protein
LKVEKGRKMEEEEKSKGFSRPGGDFVAPGKNSLATKNIIRYLIFATNAVSLVSETWDISSFESVRVIYFYPVHYLLYLILFLFKAIT